MSVVQTLPFAAALPSGEFDGTTVDGTNVLEFTGGRLHARITGGADAANSAYGHLDFGEDLTEGVLAIKDFELPTLWTTGAAGNQIDVAVLQDASFAGALFVWLTIDNRLQLRIPTGGILHSAGVNSAASTAALVAATKYQIEVAFKQNDFVRLFVNGAMVCEITGLSGGVGVVRKALWGIIAATGTWTQNVDLFESEGTIDDDITARPYSGAPAPADVPDATGLTLIDGDDATQEVTVQFSSATGYRLLSKAGADQAAPSSPTDAAWTMVSETSAGSGTRTVQFNVGDNDAEHTIAVYGYDGANYSDQAILTNVFALAPPTAIAEFRSTYLVMEIATAREGSAKIEINSDNTWVEGGNDSGTFDSSQDGGSSWRIYGSAEDYNDIGAGAALGAATFPASSDGSFLRRDYAALVGTKYAKVYEGSGT